MGHDDREDSLLILVVVAVTVLAMVAWRWCGGIR
jgi:hypothetical protein